jgi:MFS family permease
MTEQLKLKLNDSKATRWGALVIVAFTMMAAYYVNDVVAPLKTMLETDLAWSSTDFGFFTGGYSFLNVFFLMLIWGGLILDRFGIRFTGKLATILMVGGTALEYYAMTGLAGADATLFGINEIFGYKTGVFVAFAGYSIFGVGAEVAGITVSKIIAKWFKGKELATAMGVQVALARSHSFGPRFRYFHTGVVGFGSVVGRYDCFLHLCSDGQEAGQTDGSCCHCCRYGR